MPRVVVVGASLGGTRTVAALHRAGWAGEVVLVGDEEGSPEGVAADRPPLSKAVLADPTAAPAPLTTAAELAAQGARLLRGRATGLDTAGRRVRLEDGTDLGYDHLVLATGSSPRTLPGGALPAGVHVLRTAADALAVRAAAVEDARVVVVGGGFIGAEVAWTLHALGRPVTVLEPLPALMLRGLGPELGAALTRRHVEAGIDVRLGTGVASLEAGPDGHVQTVRLTDGTTLPADVVVLGLGTAPATGWLQGSGLELADGVRCDAHLAALGALGVWAVGDVARWAHPRYGEDVRVEHWTNATETATAVASGITGSPTPHAAVPSVWTEQWGGRLQVVGRVRPADDVRVVHGDLAGAFVAVTGGAGRLEAVVGLGAVKQLMPYRKLLLAGGSWDDALALAG